MNSQKTNNGSILDESYLNNFIASRIKALRLARKMTQEELAEKLNLSSQQAYSAYERGRSNISAANLYILADALKVTILDFFPASINNNISNELAIVLEDLKGLKQKYGSDVEKLQTVLMKIDNL